MPANFYQSVNKPEAKIEPSEMAEAHAEVDRLADLYIKGDRNTANFTACPPSYKLKEYEAWKESQLNSKASLILNPERKNIDCPLGFLAKMHKELETLESSSGKISGKIRKFAESPDVSQMIKKQKLL
jgi:hypothetical protein